MISEMTREHLESINLRSEAIDDMGNDWLHSYSENYLSSEVKKTGFNDKGEIVVIVGAKIATPEAAWVWILGDEKITEDPLLSIGLIEKIYKENILTVGAKYLYTFNDPSWEYPIKWLKRDGFKERGTDIGQDGKERILLVKELF
jgi:hypothetical protein